MPPPKRDFHSIIAPNPATWLSVPEKSMARVGEHAAAE